MLEGSIQGSSQRLHSLAVFPTGYSHNNSYFCSSSYLFIVNEYYWVTLFIPTTASKSLFLILNKSCIGMTMSCFIFRTATYLGWSFRKYWKQKAASHSNVEVLRMCIFLITKIRPSKITKKALTVNSQVLFLTCLYVFPYCASIYIDSTNTIKAGCNLDCRTIHEVHSAINLIFLTHRFTVWITSLSFCIHTPYLNASTA